MRRHFGPQPVNRQLYPEGSLTLRIADAFLREYRDQINQVEAQFEMMRFPETRQDVVDTEPDIAKLYEQGESEGQTNEIQELAMSVAVARSIIFALQVLSSEEK